MKLILHSYRRCPFCIRTRILLHLKGLPYEIVEEPLRIWTPWMKQWSEENSERARVPVLRYFDDIGETIMPESNEMNLFIDAVDGKPAFTPEKGSQAYDGMLEWWRWCAEELKPTIDLYKYGENLQFDTEKHPAHTKRLQDLVRKIEDALEHKKFLLEERLTLADIAVIPFIRQIMRTREGEFDFSLYPRVLKWTNELIQTDWFNDIVMKKNTSDTGKDAPSVGNL